jgi:hypothetical protein
MGELCRIIRHLGSGIGFGVRLGLPSASKTIPAAIVSAGNGLSEQKSDAQSPKTGPFLFVIVCK